MIKEKIILGVDPGTNVMGYGLLKITDNKPALLAMGVLLLKKTDDHYLRLRRIFGEHEEQGFSYALEFATESISTLEEWNKAESAAVIAPLIEKFGDKVVGFSTVMQIV